MPYVECNDFDIPFSSSNICTSVLEIGTVFTGDSGGPLILKSQCSKTLTQIGLLSFESADGDVVVFTRLTSYRRWIRDESGV